MVQAPRDLSDVANKGGSIRAECVCGRVALFAPAELDHYYKRKGFDRSWSGFAKHLRCQCGENWPKVSWLVSDPPPNGDDPPPPKPRFARQGAPAAQDNVVALRRRKVG